MVRGLAKFREQFRSHAGQYVLIGGAACDLLMEEAGLEFRATKDLDIVSAFRKENHRRHIHRRSGTPYSAQSAGMARPHQAKRSGGRNRREIHCQAQERCIPTLPGDRSSFQNRHPEGYPR